MTQSTETYRRTIALNGPWQFAIDPTDGGRNRDWYRPTAEWPDRTETVTIPHAWQEHGEYRDYTGTAWYRRTVTLDDPGRDVLLRFGAVDYETTVWVNGEEVGSNRGGYLPFAFDVTDAIVDGENTIVAEVVDPEDISEIPHGKQGAPWYQRVSGIWQDVTLEVVPSARIETVRATPNLDDDSVRVDIESFASDGEFEDPLASVQITRDGESVAVTETALDSSGAGSATISIDDPEYWSPENPALYDLEIGLERDGRTVDRYEDYFGMRSIETRNGRLYLNGDPYFMRGALDQGYYPKTLYRPFSDSLFEEEVRTAKELGFNLLRKHIKPAHPDFLECADRLGLLVWEEPANPTVHTDRSKREVREQIRGLIERDYNRPSVIVWSLYNEEWGIGNPQGLDEETSLWEDEEKQEYLTALYEETKELDPSRVICDNSGWAHVATDLNDYHRYFVSPDRATAWTEDIESMTTAPAANYGATNTDPTDAPLVVSEFGTWGMCDLPAIEAHYGETPPWFDYEFFNDVIKRPEGVYERYADTTLPDVFDDWSSFAEAWQWREFRSIKDIIEQMRAHEGVAGYVITEFSDIEWEFNGILDYRREQKAFHDAFADVNADVLVSVVPSSHALAAGDTLTADIVVSNHTTDAITDAIEWSAFDQEGAVSVDIDGFGVTRIEDAISVSVPDVDALTTEDVTVSLADRSTNAEPITVAPALDVDAEITVFVDDDRLATRLTDAGLPVERSLAEDVDVALVTTPGEAVRSFVEGGGTAIRLPGADGHIADDEFFEYRSLPETESWNLVASLFYRDGDSRAESLGVVPGWEFEGLYPYDVVADVAEGDDIYVGYVEGWIANWSGAAVVRDWGDGRVGAFTFRVTNIHNPVGLSSLVDLVEDIATSDN
ncbi:glycoside hydrolase family 2 protein (plasmid) [Haloferacaceae archaeon DSL9]